MNKVFIRRRNQRYRSSRIWMTQHRKKFIYTVNFTANQNSLHPPKSCQKHDNNRNCKVRDLKNDLQKPIIRFF